MCFLLTSCNLTCARVNGWQRHREAQRSSGLTSNRQNEDSILQTSSNTCNFWSECSWTKICEMALFEAHVLTQARAAGRNGLCKNIMFICFFSSECPCNWHFPMTFLALSCIIKISKICIFSKHGMNHFTTSIWEMCPGAHSSSASQSCSCQKCATWLSRLCPQLGLFPTFFKRLGLTWSQLT